jgi:predicted AAA+ superfamily ATPase
MPLIPRHITPRIRQSLAASPVVFLNGARQVGKSTLVHQLIDELGNGQGPARYVSFDKPTVMASAASTPEAFLKFGEGTLIIDEVQMVPEIFRALKVVVDELRLKDPSSVQGRFLLTGSANILALPRLSEALVGRMSILTMYPFSTAEAVGAKGVGLDRIWRQDFSGMTDPRLGLTDAIKLASFPEIHRAAREHRETWFDGYLNTLLQRDIRMFADLEKASLLPQLLRVLAVRAGGLINDSDIARELGMNSVTGKSYRNTLKMMFLNMDVPSWHRNIGKRLVKAPKGYLVDTMMQAYLLGVDIDRLPENRPELFGHLVENFVATELVKLMTVSAERSTLYHFRTSDHYEVDFVPEKPDGSILGIEVKSGSQVSAQDFKGLKALSAIAGASFRGGIVLYAGEEVLPFGDKLWAVPFRVLWQ